MFSSPYREPICFPAFVAQYEMHLQTTEGWLG